MWPLLLACTARHAPPHAVAATRTPWRAQVKGVLATYRAWGRVDDEARWAPFLCRMPERSSARLSEATGGDHARKLYTLYVADPVAYGFLPSADPSAPLLPGVVQAVVKEAYQPIPADQRRERPLERWSDLGWVRPAVVDGVAYVPDRIVGLYLMLLLDREDVPGTDRGWVYATATPGGAVTAAGDLPSCRGCHERAGPGRLFGLDQKQPLGDGSQ